MRMPVIEPLFRRHMETEIQQIEEVIVNWVQSFAIIEPGQEIPLDQSLLEAGILDSFGIVDMMTYVESEFDISIPDEDMTREKLGSIQKVAVYVQNCKAIS